MPSTGSIILIRLAVAVASLGLAQPTLAGLSVNEVSPRPNSLTAGNTSSITVAFSEAIDPATLTPATFAVFGQWSGAMPGELSLSEDGRVAVFEPLRFFSAGERVTVNLARTIAAPGGSPLDHGYSWHFNVGTSPATLSPVETTRISVRQKGEGQIQTYGAYAGDFNEDGYTDLAVPNERSNDFRLFLNDGTGFYRSFDVYPIPSGSRPSVNEGADFDMDGHMDYAVGNSAGQTVGLFMGDGTGKLEAAGSFAVGAGVRGLAVLDLNGDDYPDVVTAGRDESVVSTLVNDGAGSFLPATTFATPASGETAAAVADMNEDGIMDAVIGAYASGEIVVLLGEGEGTLKYHDRFTAGGAVWMVVTGDVNGDGHADVVSSNSDDATVSVLLGDGEGGLGPATMYESDNFTIAIDLGDLDGDGDLDMVSSNYGSISGDVGTGSWVVYGNDGTGRFTRGTTYHSSQAGSCVVLHDRNNDGTLDITAVDEVQDELILFTNSSASTAVEDVILPSSSFALHAYPNPIDGAATVGYVTDEPGPVLVELFDVSGRIVGTPFRGEQAAGAHQLVLDSDWMPMAPGVYFLTLSTRTRRSSVELLKAR